MMEGVTIRLSYDVVILLLKRVVPNEISMQSFKLYSPCIMITNQRFKNQHMHYILTSNSVAPTHVSASTSHLQGAKFYICLTSIS